MKDIKYSVDYHKQRTVSKGISYRALRRIQEIQTAIRTRNLQHDYLLDIGTADGFLLEKISAKVKVGIDISFDLLKLNKHHPLCASALYLPFKDKSFDMVIASALLAHVKDPLQVLKGIYRVLKNGGHLLVVSPSPLFVHTATMVGYLKKDSLNRPYSINQIKKLLNKSD